MRGDDGLLWRWMNLRHEAYLNRARFLGLPVPSWADPAGWMRRDTVPAPPPYTGDPVIDGNRFCNVFRQLDTVTEWIDRNILQPYADHPRILMMVAAARWINWPDTLAEAMADRKAWPYDLHTWNDGHHLASLLQARMDRGDKVFTGAYVIRGESNPARKGYCWPKARYVAEVIVNETRSLGTDISHSRQAMHDRFRMMHGWGDFMAYEAVTDLTYIWPLRDSADRGTYVTAGPGARRGLRRLERLGDPGMEMRDLLVIGELSRANPPGGLAEHVPALDLRAIEHSLCEFDKWTRVHRGEGKMRSKWTETRSPR